LPISAVGMGGS